MLSVKFLNEQIVSMQDLCLQIEEMTAHIEKRNRKIEQHLYEIDPTYDSGRTKPEPQIEYYI